MKFNLTCCFTFSGELTPLKKDITLFIEKTNKTLTQHTATIKTWNIEKNKLIFTIFSEGSYRPHNALLQIKNMFSSEFGKQHHIGVRDITITEYDIIFDLEKPPQVPVTIPFADIKSKGNEITMQLRDVTEEFLKRNYIDRMIARVREKVENQYYEGKAEFWKLIWESPEKQPVWDKDPTEEMVKRDWIKQGPTKGKWIYRPQAAAVLKTMETIALKEVLLPLGFKEIIISHIVPFEIWLKTGHLEGMPGELYYVAEPQSRDPQQWEHFIDLTKITKEVPVEDLKQNIAVPNAGICYAQCPVIYWSFKGKTIAERSLPVYVFDRTANSGRYESGGRHGIERVDEFHRIEPVYIGTKEQLLTLREKLLERYKHVFNTILELEWRMAWVTPWYMQQAGKTGPAKEQDTGTIDFEAYLPYRGDRKHSEWLEFQNLSILGDKYIKAFNIKAQKSELWSGCSGIGLERWTAVFLAQKGLDPDHWPSGFKKYLNTVPEGIEFL
jgi:seryl-tRNA synthetase